MKKYQLMVGNWSYRIEAKWDALPEEAKGGLLLVVVAVCGVLGIALAMTLFGG